VLVTGSTGLIGAALLRFLRDLGFEAHGAARTATTDPLTHGADLCVAEEALGLLALVSPAVVIHLAGGRERSRLYESIVAPTLNVLNAAARLEPPPSVITAGSAAEYGEPVDGVASESIPPRPVTDYGRAKLAASNVAREIAVASDLRLCIVRPFNIVSPDLPSTSALGNMRVQLLAEKGKHRVVRCGRLDVIRDFVPLGFVLDVLVRLLDLETWPEILNVCSGVGIELESVLHAMADELDVDVSTVPVPELVAIPAATRIVGDATLLRALGLVCEPTPRSLGCLLVGNPA
jgi:GDP-4-dehydro-6-deoxy-D-mannose reductase